MKVTLDMNASKYCIGLYLGPKNNDRLSFDDRVNVALPLVSALEKQEDSHIFAVVEGQVDSLNLSALVGVCLQSNGLAVRRPERVYQGSKQCTGGVLISFRSGAL